VCARVFVCVCYTTVCKIERHIVGSVYGVTVCSFAYIKCVTC